jgi:hypothetical protein
MKLTSAQVERTLTEFEGEVIPDNHPVVPQLNSLFGEHTTSRAQSAALVLWSSIVNVTFDGSS